MKYANMIEKALDIRTRSSIEWQCLCPFHDDSSPSFSVNVATGLYICYACGAKGNGEMLARHLGMAPSADLPTSLQDILRKIEDFETASKPVQHKRVDGHWWTNRYRLVPDWKRPWEERLPELSDDLADLFALGYNNLEHELVIPIFDWNGSAEGCVRRRLGQFTGPKYLYSKGFKTSQHLFGAWQVRTENPVKRPKKVAIVEGTIDALSLWSAGIQAVALLGSNVSAIQKRLLIRLDATEYVIMTDRDAAGAKAALMVEQAMRGSGSLVTRPNYWPSGCKDVAEMTTEDRRESFASSQLSTV